MKTPKPLRPDWVGRPEPNEHRGARFAAIAAAARARLNDRARGRPTTASERRAVAAARVAGIRARLAEKRTAR